MVCPFLRMTISLGGEPGSQRSRDVNTVIRKAMGVTLNRFVLPPRAADSCLMEWLAGAEEARLQEVLSDARSKATSRLGSQEGNPGDFSLQVPAEVDRQPVA
jgi:hypothetical protein